MVYIYCRVSTKKQEDNYSFSNQKKRGIEFAESTNHPYEIYSESASGTKKGLGLRKEWLRLLADLESAKKGDILWYGNDKRLSRNMNDFFSIRDLTRRKDILLYEDCEKRYIDYNKRDDRLSGGIKTVLGEEDAEELNKKLYDGLQSSWDAKKRVHTKIYGFDSSTFNAETGKRIWKQIPHEVENIKRMYELYFQGLSLHRIAIELNKEGRRKRKNKPFDYQDVSRAIKKSIYAGITTDSQGNEVDSKLYEKIVEPEIYHKIKEQYPEKVTVEKRGRNPIHLGSGMLHCPNCNSGFYFYITRGKYYYKHNAKIDCGGQKLFTYDTINMILERAYHDAIATKPNMLNMEVPKEIDSEIARYNDLIKATDKEVENYNKAIATGKSIDYFVDKITESLKLLEGYKKSKLEIEENYKNQIEKSKKLLVDFAIDNIGEFVKLTGEEKRKKLKTVIDRVETFTPIMKVYTQDGRMLEYNYKLTLKGITTVKRNLSKHLEIVVDEKEVSQFLQSVRNTDLRKTIIENENNNGI
ncbi:MAG: recombinase family protein [Vulcanibacillus sp.]